MALTFCTNVTGVGFQRVGCSGIPCSGVRERSFSCANDCRAFKNKLPLRFVRSREYGNGFSVLAERLQAGTLQRSASGTAPACLPRRRHLFHEGRGQNGLRGKRVAAGREAVEAPLEESSLDSVEFADDAGNETVSGVSGGQDSEGAAQPSITPEVADKVIDAFKQRKRPEWRKLVAFSKEWPAIRTAIYSRLDERIAARLQDPVEKSDLMRVRRGLRSIDSEVDGYRTLLQDILRWQGAEWDVLVSHRRADLTPEFFEFLAGQIEAEDDGSEDKERLIAVSDRLLTMVEQHDSILADRDAMAAAQGKMMSILEAGDMAAAHAKLDELAAKQQVDGALLLTMAKMYASCKEKTPKSEIMETMGSLYERTKNNWSRQMPAEVRILRHLLNIESPSERRAAMAEAFTPGMQYESYAEDYIYSTPQQMLYAIDRVLAAFDAARGQNTVVKTVAGMMKPVVIERMQAIRKVLVEDFM